jgi:indole-3-glycerol phosphate synthase
MILDTLAQSSRKRVNALKERVPLEELKKQLYDQNGLRSFHNREAFAFGNSLQKQEISFICEVKKASPSKGIIAKDFPYLTIAAEYEKAGADAISVLTEPEYFKGSNVYLTQISSSVQIPVLRKDFTVDEYQIYEAKLIGADAVLLICSLLDKDTIKKYLKICDELGLSALVEAHTKEEVLAAVEVGARVIGVNNRNLKTFEVDLSTCMRLRELVPKEIIFVAESGIKSSEDISILRKSNVNAVLIGETLMKSNDKTKVLNELRG